MKKFLAALTLCIVSVTIVFSQDYKVENNEVVFTSIIENTELPIKEAHDILEAYFANFYTDVNSTCKLNQENHMIYKGLYGISEQGFNTYAKAEHTLDIAIKDGRVRIKIIVDRMIYRGGTRGVYDYMIVDASPINEGSQPFNVTKKIANSYFDKLCKQVNDTFNGIEQALKSGNKNSEEDW